MGEYYISLLMHPTHARYVDMGLGIEARAARCADAWEPHLAASKSFLLNALTQYAAPASSAVVLGAGRLYDVPLREMLKSVATVRLIDADPTARAAVARSVRHLPVRYDIAEVTGQMNAQVRALQRCRSLDAVAELLRTFCLLPTSHLALSEEVVCSMNLLSQIPLYWRDDTHWRPEAIRIGAQVTWEKIQPLLASP